MTDNFGSFVKGALVGALVGAVAGVLLAPKAGEETRKDLHRLAKQWAEKAADMYEDAMDMVYEKALALKTVGKRLDEKKYLEMVKEVVDELKNDGKVAGEVATRLTSQLKRDWNKVKKAWAGEVA
ncbi:YtxH domain-containing protein [bacterium]|nr:YtxH domain-containing protein [bacterium]